MVEIIFFILGLVIMMYAMYNLYQWYSIYSNVKGRDFKTLFAEGFFGPKHISVNDSSFSDEERITLNTYFKYISITVLVFIIYFIMVYLFSR